MRATVIVRDVARGKARVTITLHPNWLARLFGARDRTAEVRQQHVFACGTRWCFERSGNYVGGAMSRFLDEALDWSERAPLPVATARKP